MAKAQQAEILTLALADTAIVALIDEATGYEKVRPQNALQAYLDGRSKGSGRMGETVPDEFYENIYKLKGWTWPGMKKNRYSVVPTTLTISFTVGWAPASWKNCKETFPRTTRVTAQIGCING